MEKIMKDIFYKEFSDDELCVVYNKLNKIIKIKDNEPYFNEKVISQLPQKMVQYINKYRESCINIFHIANIYGVLVNEMAVRFKKSTINGKEKKAVKEAKEKKLSWKRTKMISIKNSNGRIIGSQG